MAFLQKMVRGNPEEIFPLARGTIRIGRSESSNLLLTPAAASKSHATIECFESHCEVSDLNSRNGTYVNGIRIEGSQRLRHGDTLYFAGATYFYLDSEADEETLDSSGSQLRNPLKVHTLLHENLDPEQSIPRKIVRTGDVVSPGELIEFPGIVGPRVIAALDMHNRMKEALVLLGKLPRAVVRPPLVKIQPDEIERIRLALIAAGLLKA